MCVDDVGLFIHALCDSAASTRFSVEWWKRILHYCLGFAGAASYLVSSWRVRSNIFWWFMKVNNCMAQLLFMTVYLNNSWAFLVGIHELLCDLRTRGYLFRLLCRRVFSLVLGRIAFGSRSKLSWRVVVTMPNKLGELGYLIPKLKLTLLFPLTTPLPLDRPPPTIDPILILTNNSLQLIPINPLIFNGLQHHRHHRLHCRAILFRKLFDPLCQQYLIDHQLVLYIQVVL